MQIIHTLVVCPNCGKNNVIEDEDEEHGEVDCIYCGYTIEFEDPRVEIKEVEW